MASSVRLQPRIRAIAQPAEALLHDLAIRRNGEGTLVGRVGAVPAAFADALGFR